MKWYFLEKDMGDMLELVTTMEDKLCMIQDQTNFNRNFFTMPTSRFGTKARTGSERLV